MGCGSVLCGESRSATGYPGREKAEDTGAISLMEYVLGSCRYLVRDMGYSNSLYKAITLRNYT